MDVPLLLSKAQMRRIEPYFPLSHGVPRVDDRRIIPLPFSNPTKPAFGGADMKTLFITSTQMKMRPYPGVNADNIAQNGGIFALRPGEMGVVETDFAG